MSKYIYPHLSQITDEERSYCYGQQGQILWFTGLSGSGKTTLATALEKVLINKGKITCLLDGDSIRAGMNSDLGFDDASRRENIRRLAELAVYLAGQSLIVLVSAISPHASMREFAKNRADENQILLTEIYVKASLEICKQRDPKKLYQSALSHNIKNFTGIDSLYEPPLSPDLVIETEIIKPEEALLSLLKFINFSE